MEIVHIVPDGDYEMYEELTLKKDRLQKEADLYYNSYIREFGDLITESFKLKVECIALKKEIALYVKAKNTGKAITPEEVQKYLERQMSGYYNDLEDMIAENEAKKNTTYISNYEIDQIKKLYRKLAKILHPDISPLTFDYPQLDLLFKRIIKAYKCNDLKELRKLEVLVNKELEDNGIERFDVIIPDAAQRIEELERDIDDIIHSEPYTYKYLLDDSNAVEQKKTELQKEIDEYKEYKIELTEKLNQIKGGE